MTTGYFQLYCRCSRPGLFVYRRAGHQRQMRYYFNLVRARETISDPVGIELADDPAQFLEPIVLKSLAELRKEDREVANRWRGWMLEVRDVSNDVVLIIDLNCV